VSLSRSAREQLKGNLCETEECNLKSFVFGKFKSFSYKPWMKTLQKHTHRTEKLQLTRSLLLSCYSLHRSWSGYVKMTSIRKHTTI